MHLRTADNATLERLTTAFNEGYSDYCIPFKMTTEALRAHIEMNGIVLAGSFIATVDGIVAGSIFTGIRDDRAWIGGMSVVPSQRRKGIATALMAAQERELRRRGIRSIVLEVISSNDTARSLYLEQGFIDTRRLHCMIAEPPADQGTPIELDIEDSDWSSVSKRYRKDQCWQKEAASVDRMNGVRCIRAVSGDEVIGYSVYTISGGSLNILDMQGTYKALIQYLIKEHRPPVMLANNIFDVNLKASLEKAGLKEYLWQYEMVKGL